MQLRQPIVHATNAVVLKKGVLRNEVYIFVK
jgi:hypothetical protein